MGHKTGSKLAESLTFFRKIIEKQSGILVFNRPLQVLWLHTIFVFESEGSVDICWYLFAKLYFYFSLKLSASSWNLKGTCSGIALVSAQVHLLAWWISGLRTQLLCGNQGDNCCQATTGLDQCAYTVKKQHSGHASVLVLPSEKGIPITSSEK